ncbi:cytochrome P450 [Actinoallomurus acanthiterrae]
MDTAQRRPSVPTDACRAAFERLFLTADGIADPYPQYEVLRAHGSAARVDDRTWVLTGYEECAAILRDRRFGNDIEAIGTARGGPEWRSHPAIVMLTRMLLLADPPRHGRLRRMVNWSFAASRINALAPAVDAAVGELLDALTDVREADFVTEFADVLPLVTIHRLLGIGDGDRADLRDLTRTFNVLFERSMTAPQLRAADHAVAGITEYVTSRLGAKRRNPSEDLGSDLVRAVDAGDLPEDELVPLIFQIYNASYQTTMSLLGNGLYLLLSHPDEFRRLRLEPALAPAATEELLRFDPPVQSTGRYAREDIELAGQHIRRGDLVIAIIAAANRDPHRYPDPHRLDIGRAGPPSLSFGYGPHYCLGAAIADLQATLAFKAIARHDIHVELAGAPRLLPGANMRGLASLPVSVTRRPATKVMPT